MMSLNANKDLVPHKDLDTHNHPGSGSSHDVASATVNVTPQKLWGTVLAVQANFYQVQLDAPKEGTLPLPELLCTRRSRLKKLGQQVMVGDRVRVEKPDWAGNRGAIAEVRPRSSELDRPPVANADQILLVFAIEEPTLDPHQLARFLVKAESTGLKILLALSKGDLVNETQRLSWRQRLGAWGYEPYFLSLYQTDEFERIQQALREKITIVAGPSGVGKSSLINRLIPDLTLRVAKVSGKLGRGRHTTRHVELFELPQGGLLADTPGFNQPSLDCAPEALGGFFPEIRRALELGGCQFSNCLHQGEPNCAVAADWERRDDYLGLLAEVETQQRERDRQSNEEDTLKEKRGSDGQVQLEPKLAQKRFRRESRRSRRQEFSNLTGSLEDLEIVLGPEDEDA